MPFVPSFTAIATIDPTAIQFLDTSTGSDGAIVSRQILIYNTTQQLLVPAITWAYPIPNPFTVNPLQQDGAFNIVVNWLNSAGTAIYTTSIINDFVGFLQQFWYQLTQYETSNPNIIQDTNYYYSKLKLICEILSANNAITTGNDVFGSQSCIQRAIYLMQNVPLNAF